MRDPSEPSGQRPSLDASGGAWRVRGAAGLTVLTLVGALFRVVNARQDLFSDELATYWVVTAHDLRGVVRTVASDAEITPPFSFILSWLTTRVGFSPELLRLPALVAGIASIPLVHALGTRTVGRRAGLVAAALTAFSPFMILYSAEARGYGVLMALLVISTLTLLRAIEGGRALWWALHGAAVCLAMYTHYTAAFVLAAQFGWALWVHPRARPRLLAVTVAAGLLYVPWLPSVKADLDSPTTEILSSFSPLSPDMVRVTLGHWSVGFPYAFPTTSLRDLPGLVPLVLLGVAVAIGAHGMVTRRGTIAVDRGRFLLAVLLTAATPVGTFVQSVIGANVFSVRSLGASWPYLAISTAALIGAGSGRRRVLASGLAVSVFALGAVTMLGTDFRRPDYVSVARFADDHGAAVIINGAAFPPGPLTQLEVKESRPAAPVLRLGVPEQTDRPFGLGDPVPDPVDIFGRAFEVADGGPIVVVGIAGFEPQLQTLMPTLLPGYSVTDRFAHEALDLFDLRAVALELDAR